MVAAAGNGVGGEGNNTDITPFYPASWSPEIEGIISVGATTKGSVRAGYSNYGRWAICTLGRARKRAPLVAPQL